MTFRLLNGRFNAVLAVSCLALAVAGCQSGGSGQADSAPQEKVRQSELRAYCPPVTLREGTAFFNSYAKGGQDDPSKLAYQAAITDVTRSCSNADGVMTLNVAAAGKIVPGPAGAPGNVTMPIRVVAVRGDEVLYTKLHNYQVSAGGASSATQFVFNDPAVSFPTPAERNILLYVGFDEGPPKKK